MDDLLKRIVSSFKVVFKDTNGDNINYNVRSDYSIKLNMPDGTIQTIFEESDLLIGFSEVIDNENITFSNLTSIKRFLPDDFDYSKLENELVKFCRKDYIKEQI